MVSSKGVNVKAEDNDDDTAEYSMMTTLLIR